MDFENVLSIASQNQGLSKVPTKRYSLQTGPPKKVPKVKGVQSTAVQAFLKRKEMEQKRKELESKKQKEELLAKRVELKSDRKARAMASRTKDNFRGYNGIPVVDQPKKRHSKGDASDNYQRTSSFDEDDEDNYAYSQTDSEPEPELEKPQFRCEASSKNLSKTNKKPSAPAKPAPPPLKFTDLLKLAEKKQFEPVELKPTKKSEERLRTAGELKELEMERRVKKQDRSREAKSERDCRPPATHGASKKSLPDKGERLGKSHKSPSVRLPPGETGKRLKTPASAHQPHSSAKPSQGDRPKHSSSSSGALSGKMSAKVSPQVSSKHPVPRPSSGQKPTSTSDLTQRRGNPPLPPGKAVNPGMRRNVSSGLTPAQMSGQGRPGSNGVVRANQGSNGQVRPSLGSGSNGNVRSNPGPGSNKLARPGIGKSGNTGSTVSPRPAKGELLKSGYGTSNRPGNNGQVLTVPGGPSRQASDLQARVGVGSQTRPGNGGVRPLTNGPGRPGSGVPGRPINGMGSGPGRPKCTVVAETISSKNFVPKPGMAPRLPPGHRPVMRPPGPLLPPITSSYKRKFEEEEYDSEMEDFIDDEGGDQDEISKHIREIFGYDRSKYKDESDYALKFMESSWRDQQKEEARSLRLGIKEDEEDMAMEDEERKRKLGMNAKRKKV